MASIKYREHDQVLNSLDSLRKAAAPDFFYSKLLRRMEGNSGEMAMRTGSRPVYAFVLLIVFLMVNITVLVKEKKTGAQDTSKVESFADAYRLNTSSLYE